jgi:cytoskeleton-associated protein 5
VTSDCIEGIVSKCVAAPKAKTKDLAKQIALMFVEIETYEKVIEELLKGLSNKNPKVVFGCISIMTACLHDFGAKVIKVSPLLKAIVPLLDHKDKTVREESKGLIVEAYRWVGDIMKQQLNGVKPVQMTELEAAFEKCEKAKKGERLLRSQQTFAGGAADDDGEEGEEKSDDKDDDGDDAADDPYELLDPVDILDKLPKNFYELVEEKKWQLRKEALDALLPLSQTPKLSPSGDYNDLIRVLKKFISKDANVMLVTLAAQCLAGIAKGLRTGFKNGASICLPVVLEKFK